MATHRTGPGFLQAGFAGNLGRADQFHGFHGRAGLAGPLPRIDRWQHGAHDHFTTAMHAGIIHVLEKGHIVESRTHAELVSLGRAYANSWAAQMREIGNA
jgi:hypothetical protein